jgi:hypothetical protein
LVALSAGAVNKLLLGKRNELSALNLISTFHGTGGRESPAGTALSLVLNRGNGTLSSPVDRGGVGGNSEVKVITMENGSRESLGLINSSASRLDSSRSAPRAVSVGVA